ncbi:MAG: hypothetical protein Q4G40_05885 [Brachybacterium sp.]|nr:hypothetical protein [Brachybacterium sp.]
MHPWGQDLQLRPLPVDAQTALLIGVHRTLLHAVCGAAGALLIALALGGLAEASPELDNGGLDVLARAMMGPILTLPLLLGVLAVACGAAVLRARRRTAGHHADRFRPLATERYELARSPSSRMRTVLLVSGLVLGGLTVLFAGTVLVGGDASMGWVPAVSGALAGACFAGRAALRTMSERAGDEWDAYRARWPRIGVRPREDSLAWDDRSWGRPPFVASLAGLATAGVIGLSIWGMMRLEEGDATLADTAWTPFHLAALAAVLAALLLALQATVAVVHRVRVYRMFARDPQRAARTRVEGGQDPTEQTAAARELLRDHPSAGPCVVIAVLGGILVHLAPTEAFLPLTDAPYEGAWARSLWFAVAPGVVLLLAAISMHALAARALVRHRLEVLQALGSLDPVLARKKITDGEGGSVERIVYGNDSGDYALFEKYSDDSPR